MRWRRFFLLALLPCIVFVAWTSALQAQTKLPATSEKVYGEWKILVKTDKGAEYDQLIEAEGLPLFRAAGGQMIGWWKTLVGNLYEHVTIWEYDDMAAFEKAVVFLSSEPKFAAFVAKRDPLLAAEESRFLKLVPAGIPFDLHDPSKFVIHETHRVPLVRQQEYLNYLIHVGLPLLRSQGFRPVGPCSTAIGKWSELTLLFRFDSLAEREALIAKFMSTPEGLGFARKIAELTDEVTTRLLLPASFAKPPKTDKPTAGLIPSSLLKHMEQLTPRVFAVGFSDQFQSANCGFFTTSKGVTLVDVPQGITGSDFVGEVERVTGMSPDRLVVTHAAERDLPTIEQLIKAGIREVVTTRHVFGQLVNARLSGADAGNAETPIRVFESAAEIGDTDQPVQFIPLDGTAAAGSAAVVLNKESVLFGGPLVVHGPRTRLVGSDTAAWIDALKPFERDNLRHVVPGYGTWGDTRLITRQRRFLEELRSQVGYLIAMSRPPEVLDKQVRISPDFLVWMPYDNPIHEDLLYVYRELTVPIAPFGGCEPEPDERARHALVLIGDSPHEPQHLERGLRPIFDGTNVIPHFTVDVNSLNAENLSRVGLLVVLRDGLMRPNVDDPNSTYAWIKKEQEQTVVDFVERGGAFLNLHNSLGLYPADGAYLRLAAGRYIGHGPLERFRVEPVDSNHPITRGIPPFSIADEQHTPVVDLPRVKQLFRSQADNGTIGVAGWVYEPGAGRFCHLANGHTRDALEHPVYQRVMKNAVLWCTRQEAL